jgi:hypothetical protein
MTKAAMVSLLPQVARREAFAEASRFRGEFYACLTARRSTQSTARTFGTRHGACRGSREAAPSCAQLRLLLLL